MAESTPMEIPRQTDLLGVFFSRRVSFLDCFWKLASCAATVNVPTFRQTACLRPRLSLRDTGQVRILAARPNGRSGGGVDRFHLPFLASKIVPVHQIEGPVVQGALAHEGWS
jgi:hypothetical protein